MSEESRMVCATVKSGIVPVDGSTITHCTKCNEEVWISGASLFEHPDIAPWCLACCPEVLDPNQELELPQGKPAEDMVKRLREEARGLRNPW